MTGAMMDGCARPTPFHVRMAEHNSGNAWTLRERFTVAAHYGDPVQEALAARVSVAMIDISANEDLQIAGAGAAALLSAASGSDLQALSVGRSQPMLWCADGGGVRGVGVVSRFGESEFLLRSFDTDMGWFGSAAPRFGVSVRDVTAERGLLLLAGPFAAPVLEAAGLKDMVGLRPGRHATTDWRGLGTTIFRRGPLGAYQIACAREDGVLVFDRLFRAGRAFGLRLAGQDALDLLHLEAGLALPYVDFQPARLPFAREPSAASLGFVPPEPETSRVLAGIELDSDDPASFRPLIRQGGGEAGHTLRSAYSPALRRAIALALVIPACAVPGTELLLRRASPAGMHEIPAHVAALPFLP
jgi:aminomethyltransferase